MTATIDRDRLAGLKVREDELFRARRPRSLELSERAHDHMLDGVPMNWMTRWSSPYPPFVAEAHGASFTCVDGHTYIDFCLGDTGAMTGHSPAAPVAAAQAQLARGITTMLPTEDSLWVAGELSRRFGLQYWQMALTATDANRFALRLARQVTKRGRSSSTATATTGRSTRRSSPSTTACRAPSRGTPARPSTPRSRPR